MKKSYSARSGLVRAASKELGVPRSEVNFLILIYKDETGRWSWKPLDKTPKKEEETMKKAEPVTITEAKAKAKAKAQKIIKAKKAKKVEPTKPETPETSKPETPETPETSKPETPETSKPTKAEAIQELARDINTTVSYLPEFDARVAKAKAVEVSVKVAPRTTLYLVPSLRDTNKVHISIGVKSTLTTPINEITSVEPKVTKSNISWIVDRETALEVASTIKPEEATEVVEA